jgi:hypothetical protein
MMPQIIHHYHPINQEEKEKQNSALLRTQKSLYGEEASSGWMR